MELSNLKQNIAQNVAPSPKVSKLQIQGPLRSFMGSDYPKKRDSVKKNTRVYAEFKKTEKKICSELRLRPRGSHLIFIKKPHFTIDEFS